MSVERFYKRAMVFFHAIVPLSADKFLQRFPF